MNASNRASKPERDKVPPPREVLKRVGLWIGAGSVALGLAVGCGGSGSQGGGTGGGDTGGDSAGGQSSGGQSSGGQGSGGQSSGGQATGGQGSGGTSGGGTGSGGDGSGGSPECSGTLEDANAIWGECPPTLCEFWEESCNSSDGPLSDVFFRTYTVCGDEATVDVGFGSHGKICSYRQASLIGVLSYDDVMSFCDGGSYTISGGEPLELKDCGVETQFCTSETNVGGAGPSSDLCN